jgi:hypothetical protein
VPLAKPWSVLPPRSGVAVQTFRLSRLRPLGLRFGNSAAQLLQERDHQERDQRRSEDEALCREDRLGDEDCEEDLYGELREELTGEMAVILSEEEQLQAERDVQARGDQAQI